MEHLWIDTSREIPKAMTAFKRLVGQDVIVTQFQTTEISEPLRVLCDEYKVVGLAGSSSYNCVYPPGYCYCINTAYSDQFGGFLRWVKENWKETRPPKVAMVPITTANGVVVTSLIGPSIIGFLLSLANA